MSAVVRPPSGPAWRVGADENGLGARLGPLVVTAVHSVDSASNQTILKQFGATRR